MVARVVIHGHFYQPPREDPRDGTIAPQPSAAPFHDWNERVHAECYLPNVAAHILTKDGERTVNNLEHISFNFGPTLMTWLERTHPSTYEAILEADRISESRLGHGNAIAQAFHHTILPLGSLRDARTQVRWGLADFEYRFGRPAEGMWLPEAAVNHDVLAILIEEGVAFTVLAPHQAAEPVDTNRFYRFVHPDGSGRSIALWFYDGPRSRGVAFDKVTSSAERFLDHLSWDGMERVAATAVATDGETYGHHHKFADICLAYACFVEAPRRGIQLTSFAALLERWPPREEVRLAPGEGTSWSCTHGVGRWKEDCGCATGGEPEWHQRWRAPLRRALEHVQAAAADVFERDGARLFHDPWGARDRYVDVVLGARSIDDFLAAECSVPVTADAGERASTLLRLQEMSMAMFTSCGWFFNDIGGIETVQILRYAARALDLLTEAGVTGVEERFLQILGEAKSNDVDKGTAADIFSAQVRSG